MFPDHAVFKVVSSPHYLAEIIIYTSFMIITKGAVSSLWALYAWVVVNQAVTAYTNHVWYKANFKNYPKERAALIPFIF